MKIRFHAVIKRIFQIVRHPACLMEKRLDIIHALFRFQTGCFQQLPARNFFKAKVRCQRQNDQTHSIIFFQQVEDIQIHMESGGNLPKFFPLFTVFLFCHINAVTAF